MQGLGYGVSVAAFFWYNTIKMQQLSSAGSGALPGGAAGGGGGGGGKGGGGSGKSSPPAAAAATGAKYLAVAVEDPGEALGDDKGHGKV